MIILSILLLSVDGPKNMGLVQKKGAWSKKNPPWSKKKALGPKKRGLVQKMF